MGPCADSRAESIEFNPETAQKAGSYVPPGAVTQATFSYQKRVSLNGNGQDQPFVTVESSGSLPINATIAGDLLLFGLSFDSFDVVTISEVPILTWRQYAYQLISTLGTVYAGALTISAIMARVSAPFRKSKSHDPESAIILTQVE